MMKKTLIINYAGLSVGGIEDYLSKLMKYSIKEGHRVIWLTTPMHVENAFYKDLANSPYLEKVYIGHGRTIFKKMRIKFDSTENIVMISFEPLYFIAAEQLRRNVHVSSFSHFLLLPHFTGNAYYIERFFKVKCIRKVVYKYISKLIYRWVDYNCILGFTLDHLSSYEKNYLCKIDKKEEKIIKKVDEKRKINMCCIKEKAKKRNQDLHIVTCARFDFPHKGYLIGLIKQFGILKKQFPDWRLIIVGDGKGKAEIEKQISLLPISTRQDIELKGFLEFEELCKVFDQSTVNVGLAGGATSGAKCAVPTVVVRHYTYECEAYGFYNDVKDKILSTSEGKDIKQYIEKIASMSNEEYVKLSIDTYNAAYMNNESDPDYIFKVNNERSNATVSTYEFWIGRIINYICWFKMRFLNEKGYELWKEN